MAIPGSSDGLEVLRSGQILTQSNSWTALKFDGTSPSTATGSYTVPANHIITMLSIIWAERGNSAEVFHFAHQHGYVLIHQALAAYGTFVWNERMVCKGGENYQTVTTSTANVDILYSYLDQDWS